MCLVTDDFCHGSRFSDDENYKWKGYWSQMGQQRQAGRPGLCRQNTEISAKVGFNINPVKTMIIKVGKCIDAEDERIMIDGREEESVNAFFLDSVMGQTAALTER